MTGYSHPLYAESLAEFGTPRPLPECGGWLIERPIPESGYLDAMGCYPLFACRDWSRIPADFDGMRNKLVSVALVTDPFGDYDEPLLGSCFDVVTPFKEHFVADLSQPMESIVSSHHRQYGRKYSKGLDVHVCTQPPEFRSEWFSLYANLIERHDIGGIRAFSETAFRKQLALPGVVVVRAEYEGETAGAQLWLVQGDIAYSHLTACSPLGYEKCAAYAMNWFAVQYFKEQRDDIGWLDIGAGPGVKGDSGGGLVQFKRGWATGTRAAYFCGRILDRARYTEIVSARNASETDYFPAYRAGEFQ